MNNFYKKLELHIHPNKQLILQHPFLLALNRGDLSKKEIQDFGIQYSYLYDYLPRFTSAVITRIPDTATRMPFVEYLWEEHGRGVVNLSYNHLMKIFLDSIEVDINKPTLLYYSSTIEYSDQLIDLCLNERVPIGFGVLVIGIIFWFPEEFNLIISGLNKYKYIPRAALEFWDTRKKLMKRYYPLMASVVEKWIDANGKEELFMQGARRAMELKLGFWEGLARSSSPDKTFFIRSDE